MQYRTLANLDVFWSRLPQLSCALLVLMSAGCEAASDSEDVVVLPLAEAAMEPVREPAPAVPCPPEPVPASPSQPEVAPSTPDAPEPRRALNLAREEDNVYAWRKTRGSLDPNEEVVFYWQGFVYNVTEKTPEDYPQRGAITFEEPLFRFEGFNVARLANDGTGDYMMVSREVSVYQDPRTGRPLNCWRNTLLEDSPEVRVLHVMNDPVNFGVGSVSYVEIGGRISFFSDVLLAYRSPLAGNPTYADFSAGDVYQSNELFNFYVDRDALEDENVQSAPVEISWTRMGQYLPWMQMGDLPGHLVYHVRGYKVLGGVDALPPALRQWTRDEAGEAFLHAPETLPRGYTPNATTWRVFKERFDTGEYTPECD